MKNQWKRLRSMTIRKWLVMAALMLTLVAVGPALAMSAGPYDLSWNTIDGGGDSSGGGSYAISGTVGQADAALSLTGGSYSLVSGFWSGTEGVAPSPPGDEKIYLPIVIRNG